MHTHTLHFVHISFCAARLFLILHFVLSFDFYMCICTMWLFGSLLPLTLHFFPLNLSCIWVCILCRRHTICRHILLHTSLIRNSWLWLWQLLRSLTDWQMNNDTQQIPVCCYCFCFFLHQWNYWIRSFRFVVNLFVSFFVDIYDFLIWCIYRRYNRAIGIPQHYKKNYGKKDDQITYISYECWTNFFFWLLGIM